jgi:hypothetical protein
MASRVGVAASPFGVRLRQWRMTRHLSQLEPFRRAIDRLLVAHEPFPALVLDAYSQAVATNRSCTLLFGPDLAGTNMIERYLTDASVRDGIVNWPEVAWAALARLRTQLHVRHWTTTATGHCRPGPTARGHRYGCAVGSAGSGLRLSATGGDGRSNAAGGRVRRVGASLS